MVTYLWIYIPKFINTFSSLCGLVGKNGKELSIMPIMRYLVMSSSPDWSENILMFYITYDSLLSDYRG